LDIKSIGRNPGLLKPDPKEFVDGSLIERLKQEKFAEGLKY